MFLLDAKLWHFNPNSNYFNRLQDSQYNGIRETVVNMIYYYERLLHVGRIFCSD